MAKCLGQKLEKYKLSEETLFRWINGYLRNLYRIVFADNYVHRLCKYADIKYQGKHYKWQKPKEENKIFNILIWNGWNKVKKPLQIIISDMTAFYVKKTYYELTMYFDVWNKEIIGYELSSLRGDVRTYYNGLNQVLERIKKNKPTN